MLEKSADFELQRKTFSMHKHTNLLKPMVVLRDGYILEAEGLFYADGDNNDATILKDMLNNGLPKTLQNCENLVFDRGFRDAVDVAKPNDFNVSMSAFLSRSSKQFSTAQASETRLVTMVRGIVEVVNDRQKNKIPHFVNVIRNSNIPTLNDDFILEYHVQ